MIWDIDTRALVRHLREVGALRGVVSTDGTPAEQLIAEARALPTMAGQELASRVTSAKEYDWTKGSIDLARSHRRCKTAHGRQRSVASGKNGATPLPRRRLRFRHQAKYSAPARRSWLRRHRRARENFRRRCARAQAQRRFPLEWPRRSRADHLRRRKHSQAARPRPDLRHLPRPPALRPGARRQNLQTEIRPSRLESSGEKSAHRESRNHRAESRLLRRSRIRCRRATSKSRT